ncbi:MAG: hypothetical protein ACI4J0_02415 [Huintestinicola sp.]|uniref:hypothetical protein n=1 Tax=Huintestinicola sp. TaxID=2981661 RepID=UPI003EFF5576
MSETTKTIENAAPVLDPNKTYLLGYTYIRGDYSMTDEKTGEVREGTSDKWELTFATPVDITKKNLQAFGGHSISRLSVKNANLPFILGVEPQFFGNKSVDKFLLQPVILQYIPVIGNDGKMSYKLRGISIDKS